MSQGTKIVAVVLFVLFVGTGVYYVTFSPASPPAARAPEPAAPKPPPARDPGSITMNPPANPPANLPVNPPAPRIADPLASGSGSTAAPAPVTPSAAPRVALAPGGTPTSVMPPLAVSRPATPSPSSPAGAAPVRPVAGSAAATPAVTPSVGVATGPAPASTATSATAGPREHVVASGETLSSIAARYLGSETRWAEIAKANPGVNPNSMRVGTKLAIPSAASGSSSAGTRTASAAASSAPALSGTEYIVKAGDTLTGIARQTLGSADWESIYEANRSVIGANPAALRVGMRLSIPKRS